MASAQRERWSAERAHVDLDVQTTDIHGVNVVVEFENELRSIAVAPCGRRDGSRLGGLAAVSDERDAFDQWQIEGLGLAGRLVGAALDESVNQVELRSA